MDALTAAHRTMPLGSIVRVVNLENGKHLHVRITDRGPYVNGRILDLSRAAAFRLGMEQGGLAHVQIAIVGQRRPELLQFAQDTSGRASLLLFAGKSMAKRAKPSITSGLRVLPSDVWLSRRIRRVPALLAADHTAHGEASTLLMS
jgi:rare lipoprotein A